MEGGRGPQRPATAVGLLERLDEVEGLVVTTVGDKKPVWVPPRLRDTVLTPADAKGLEYQSVCVLDPGRLLARLEAATGPAATRTSQALREHEHRTAIDQLRVALSRATETLAFVDVVGDDDAHELSAELLEDAAPYHADDLVEHFAADAPPEERVQARNPRRAGAHRHGPGAGVAAGVPGDAPARRPTSAQRRLGRERAAWGRARPRSPRRPVCSSTASLPASAVMRWSN